MCQRLQNLISKTSSLSLTFVEDADDIKVIQCEHDKTQTCVQCLKCNSVSGTLRIINHRYTCKYSQSKRDGPFVEGSVKPSLLPLDSSRCVTVLQREYGIVCKESLKPIIRSFGAFTCVILCMRNRQTTETILAHIDANTLNPLEPFLHFPPDLCDVFVVGGEKSSIDEVNSLLLQLLEQNYSITYANIIDENENMFAINSVDGSVYCHNNKPYFALRYDEVKQLSLPMHMMHMCSMRSPLILVY